MFLLRICLITFGFVFFIQAAPIDINATPHPAKYRISDLGYPPHSQNFFVNGINNNGLVFGDISESSTANEANFLYDHGSYTVIPLPEGFHNWGRSFLNDKNQFVFTGGRYPTTGNTIVHTFFREADGTVRDLDANAAWLQPEGLNSLGHVLTNDQGHGNTIYLYDNAQASRVDVPISALMCVAHDYNDQGQIVGYALVNVDTVIPFLLNPDGSLINFKSQFGDFEKVTPVLLNNNGEVIFNSDTTKFYLYADNSINEIPLLPNVRWTEILKLNDLRQAVGNSNEDDPARKSFPFIYCGGETWNLYPLIENLGSWSELYVRGINNKGEIVGIGTVPAGEFASEIHIFLLTPVE